MSFRAKLIVVGILQLAIVCGILFHLYAQHARTSIRDQYVEKARSIVLTTESAREAMARKWDSGIFNAEMLSEWAQAGEKHKVLQAVPVVTAWESAMAKADEGGYTFKVPKVHPRNSGNEPDALEATVLSQFEQEDLAEYHVVDESINAVRYFRPIKLTEECLLCHGDPALSQKYWNNDQGLDPTGTKMENWKVGEVHGAFEVVQSLDQADAELASTLWQGAGIVGGLLVIAAVILFVVITRVVIRNLIDPVKHISLELNEGAIQVNSAAGQVSDAAQMLAEGASEQAASLEETAGAMKDITRQSKANASSAGQVRDISGQARDAAQSGDRVMSELNLAMGAISQSSDKIANIIKTIEEIAFQTNLLALSQITGRVRF